MGTITIFIIKKTANTYNVNTFKKPLYHYLKALN